MPNDLSVTNISIVLIGGPVAPTSRTKWVKDGAAEIQKYLVTELNALGYSGEFVLNGVSPLKGGSQKFVRFGQILANRNALEVTAQLGSRESRWRYELAAPQSVDVVELSEHLKARQVIVDKDADDDPSSDEEVTTSHYPTGLLPGDESFVDGDEFPFEVEQVVPFEVSIPPQIGDRLLQIEKLSAEFLAAQQLIKDSGPEIERIQHQISEAQQLLAMYLEENRQARLVLESKPHQEADEKLRMIHEILGS